MQGDVEAAREVLVKALDTNPESEQIWLASVKLGAEKGELAVERELLGRARSVADTERLSDHFRFSVSIIISSSLLLSFLPTLFVRLFRTSILILCRSLDLNEIGCLRTSTIRIRPHPQNPLCRHPEIPQIRQTLHDPRPNLPLRSRQHPRRDEG